MLRRTAVPSLCMLAALPAPALAQAADSASRTEWSIEPRARLQVDVADIGLPAAVPGDDFGTQSEIRRGYLGVNGTLPGNLGFRVEADFAGPTVELTDVYLTYEPAEGMTLTLGQHKPFFGLGEQTSDLFTSMLERAAFNSAFGFERRIGFSGTYSRGDVRVELGAFTVNAMDLDAADNSFGANGRVVFSPRVGPGVLHLGGSAHIRDLEGDDADAVRYRARPFVHTTDTRLVDTASIGATGERSFGAELAYIAGPLHATLEGHRITARRPGLPDPDFWGGYAEVGLLVTPGDTTSYEDGTYGRIRPVRPVGQGGIGAIQLNLRYDRLDLNDETILGGQQQMLGISAIWVPVASVRLLANYGRLWISDAPVPAGPVTDYSADTMGLRAQFDF